MEKKLTKTTKPNFDVHFVKQNNINNLNISVGNIVIIKDENVNQFIIV